MIAVEGSQLIAERKTEEGLKWFHPFACFGHRSADINVPRIPGLKIP
jgi:hypothetical protein